ncbi:hypothetical protein [Kitasatospora viridis]|uniref:Acetoacetate decarboxylase n=1 Tax=Kitasatospora viridis TaxID=281105 RepID=A0A561UQC4_9ACTN|nr:hypothetical protein [Kitasatospora viridis]TWG01529.1 hypothetical protein FHX73_115430 [Kitasatospora viridis]
MTNRPLPLPPVAEPYQLPFHYGALHMIGVDWLVDPEPARAVLAKRHPALEAATFEDGRACVSVNYQLYFAQYPFGGGMTQEVEVNVIARPRGSAGRLPELGYRDYARGYDQTKLLGIARIHVLCDNPHAIDAGRRLYAEPKHPGSFEVSMPSLNGPSEDRTWEISGKVDEETRFTLRADLAGLETEPVVTAPVTGYGTDEQGRLLAGPMNVYQPFQLRLLADRADAAERVRLDLTDPGSEVGQLLGDLLGTAAPAGVWTYQSAPVAAHLRAYYLPTEAG